MNFIIEKLKLGIVYKDGKIINHRSLIKVIFNPILRSIGLCIGTSFNKGILGNPEIFKCNASYKIDFKQYKYNETDTTIIRKRIFI